MTRRDLISTLPLAGAAGLDQKPGAKLTVAVFGAHPDDPETGAGGTMALYSGLGHDVISLYLTRGEAGITGKTHEEAARIRTAEAETASKTLGARAVFVGQIDGAVEINPARYRQFRELLAGLRPNIVYAHWPIDTHPDHRAASLFAYDAWLASRGSFQLYYFEVSAGYQTQDFSPSLYIDISGVEQRKREAVNAHRSQNPASMWANHAEMHRFRGREGGVKLAEAFIRHSAARAGLP